MAVPVKADLEAQLATLAARLGGSALRQMDQRRQSVRALVRALPSLDQLLALPRRRFDEAAAGLGRGLERTTIVKRRQFERASSGLRVDLLSGRIQQQRQRLAEAILRAERQLERQLLRGKGRVDRAEAALVALPARLSGQLQRERQQLTALSRQADTALTHALSKRRAAVTAQDRVLQSLSYTNVLNRGFAVIRGEDDRPLTRAAALGEGQGISIQFADGRVAARTQGEGEEPAAPSGPVGHTEPVQKKRAPKSPAPEQSAKAGEPGDPPKQGSLF